MFVYTFRDFFPFMDGKLTGKHILFLFLSIWVSFRFRDQKKFREITLLKKKVQDNKCAINVIF